jgi:protein SCO1/2
MPRKFTHRRCSGLVLAYAFSALACATQPAQAEAPAPKPLPTFERVMSMTPPRAVANFELTDHQGARRSLGSFIGEPTLVFFGFTNCPDVCPVALQKLALVKAAHAEELRKLRVVMISVDGERDTPEVMKAYLAQFSKDFIGLTGPADRVREMATSFSAPFFRDPPKEGAYLVQHSSRVYALDRRGRLRAELYDASPDATAGLARSLLAER